MPPKMDRYRILEVNPTKRLPVCFLIDTSFSMRTVKGGKAVGATIVKDGRTYQPVEGHGPMRIETLMNGVNQYISEIENNTKAYSSVELAIVSFGDNARVVRDFAPVNSKEVLSIEANDNNTYLGSAVKNACQLLARRKQEYKNSSVGYFQPQLVIFTDGCATDTNVCSEVAQEVQRLMSKSDLFCLPFLIGTEEGRQVLSLFGPSNDVFTLDEVNILEVLRYLSQSAISLSSSQTGTSSDIYNRILKDIRNKKKDWREVGAARG